LSLASLTSALTTIFSDIAPPGKTAAQQAAAIAAAFYEHYSDDICPVGTIKAWHKTFGEADSGTTTGTSANKLIEAGQNFETTVESGMIVINTTDDTESYVVSVDSDTQLTLADDIMVNGEDYVIYKTPVLPETWVECNGKTINDADSPYNGEKTPNLNGDSTGDDSPGLSRKEKMFLRGCATGDGETSGTGQDQATAKNNLTMGNQSANHSHSVTGGSHQHEYAAGQSLSGGCVAFGCDSDTKTNIVRNDGGHTHTCGNNNANHTHTLSSVDTETRPPVMYVVWIIKIK